MDDYSRAREVVAIVEIDGIGGGTVLASVDLENHRIVGLDGRKVL